MPTFNVQAALQAGVPQDKINSFLQQHPEFAGSSSSTQTPPSPTPTPSSLPVPSSPASQSTPSSLLGQGSDTFNPSIQNQNTPMAPVVGSAADIGYGINAAVTEPFMGAATAIGGTDQDRAKVAEATLGLMRAANQTTDPARRARLLQVAHDNVSQFLNPAGVNAERVQGIFNQGQAPQNTALGTVSPPTSLQEAAGTALKTGSLAVPGGGLAMGATYGAGNTLEQQGTNATPTSVAEHTATNAVGFWLGEKALGAVSDALGTGNSKAVIAANKTFQEATQYRQQIGQDLIKGAQELTQTSPDAIANIQGNGELLQKLSEVPGMKIDTLAQGGFTPADIQTISSQINKTAAMSSEKTAAQLYGLNSEFRTWAQGALNASSPGTGDALEGLYDTAQSKYEGMKAVGDVFKPNGNPSAKDVTNLTDYVKQQMSTPQGRMALKQTMLDWSKTSGIDLTDKVKAMSYINTLPTKAQTTFNALWKLATGVGIEEGIRRSFFGH